ncbi:hypothetical protein ACS0TY_006482 [Phlomoides rotata]
MERRMQYLLSNINIRESLTCQIVRNRIIIAEGRQSPQTPTQTWDQFPFVPTPGSAQSFGSSLSSPEAGNCSNAAPVIESPL